MSEVLKPLAMLLARMEIARQRGKAFRLSLADLEILHISIVGEWMAAYAEEALKVPSTPTTSPTTGAGR